MNQLVEWYLQSSLLERLMVWALPPAIMFFSWRALRALAHNNVAWFRGFHSTPVFQLFLWLTAFPLIVPFFLMVRARKAQLARAGYIGNLYSRVYHRRDCEYQKRIGSLFQRFPLEGTKMLRGVDLDPVRGVSQKANAN